MRFAVLASVVFAALAAAAPAPGGGTANACQGGTTVCCNNADQLANNSTGGLASVPIDVLLNGGCSPLSVLSIVLGLTCPSTTVCCQDVGTNGLVNVQCLGLAL